MTLALAIPLGFCQCGCGRRTTVATKTDRERGQVKGQPVRYIQSHFNGIPHLAPPNPKGLCMCGCGEQTGIAKQSHAKSGYVRGEHVKWIVGHHRRGVRMTTGPDYLIDPDTGCWIWQHNKTRGYGRTRFNQRTVAAHVVYYIRAKGPVPDGMELDHLCRNRACVNPDHLEPVTHDENVQRGPTARLSRAAVVEIRASDASPAALALRFGVSKATVRYARQGKTWKNVA